MRWMRSVNWDWRTRSRARAPSRGAPKFGNPGANVSNVQYNPDGSIRNLNGFAEITSASEERQFQLGLRLSF